MTSIQVFDPALCCSTGVCGVDVDQQLIGFSADVDWARQNGRRSSVFNWHSNHWLLPKTPCKGFLERSGAEALR